MTIFTPAAVPSNNQLARLIGLLYFVFAVLGIFSFMYVHPRIFTEGDPVDTAQKMLSRESLFHLSKAAGMLSNILFILIVLLLQKLFHQVNVFQARLMVALVLVGIPVALMGDALDITALEIYQGNLLAGMPTEQSHTIAMMLLTLGGNAAQLLTVFWGLWLFPLGVLIYQSSLMPRIFGILLWINGLGYVIHGFTFLSFPDQLPLVLKFIFPTYFAGEIPFLLWLLIKGVKEHTRSHETNT